MTVFITKVTVPECVLGLYEKNLPAYSRPNRGPRFAELFFSLVYMRTLYPSNPGKVWSRGIVMIFGGKKFKMTDINFVDIIERMQFYLR